MMLAVRGRADAATAWERYAVIARWPGWAPQIQRVSASADRIAAGVTGTVHGWLGVRARFVVDTVDEASRRWSWTVSVGPLRVRLEHGVAARPGGCLTTLHIHAPLPVALVYAPVARLALRRLVAA